MVVISPTGSYLSAQSSVTNENSVDFLSQNENVDTTRVQEGCFVFRVEHPELIVIRRLQDLYQQETDEQKRRIRQHQNRRNGRSGRYVFRKNELLSVDMIVITSRSSNSRQQQSVSSFDALSKGSNNDVDGKETIDIGSSLSSTGEESNYEEGFEEDDYYDDDIYSTSTRSGGEKLDGYSTAKSSKKRKSKGGNKKSIAGALDADESESQSAQLRLGPNESGTASLSETISSTYARLSDHSGWITIEVDDFEYVEQVAVEMGLYSFYVDNVPVGILPRRHPMDDNSGKLSTENCIQDFIHLPPMTKIYCDYRVVHPITGIQFYRLQRPNSSCFPMWVHNIEQSDDIKKYPDVYKLIPVNKIKKGYFAYRAVQGTILRTKPDCTEESKINSHTAVILPNDIVIADLTRESPLPQSGNGPFLRINSYGWLFEKKLNDAIFVPVPIYRGFWEFQVILHSAWASRSTDGSATEAHNDKDIEGIYVYQQPLDRCLRDDKFVTMLRVGDYVQCDRKIVHRESTPTGNAIHYYFRIILKDGKSGWIIDKQCNDIRNEQARLQLLSHYDHKDVEHLADNEGHDDELFDKMVKDEDDSIERSEDGELDEWKPDFVRDIVMMVRDYSITELEYQTQTNVLKFQTSDFVLINVFCSTKTVQIAFEHSIDIQSESSDIDNGLNMIYRCYRNCSVQKLTNLMKISVTEMLSKAIFASRSEDEDDVEDSDEDDDYHPNYRYDEDEKKDESEIAGSDSYKLIRVAEIQRKKQKSRRKQKHRLRKQMYLEKEAKVQVDEKNDSLRELEVRNELLECDIQITKLLVKRQALWDTVKLYEDKAIQDNQPEFYLA